MAIFLQPNFTSQHVYIMISKILIGIILVFVLQLGIMGFIIAIIGESIISSITMLILIRSKNVFGMIDKIVTYDILSQCHG